ncbi:MAG: exosome subunit [Candidatus Thermoplasmatota archaeon]|nr:exosome subunit [Candidatus Thermoplasmatota archaeon]MBS3790134.1 exosome subunit [Candidatus Thermoplasmatota archaeon]
MTFHYVEFMTHCHATERLEKVKKAVENLAGRELELETSDAEGYYGNPIKILEGKISRNQEIDEFFSNLPEKVVEDLKRQIERRIDERCNFFFRIDKGKAYEEELILTSGGNSIRVRARVESYPSKKETAVEKMEDYLSQL